MEICKTDVNKIIKYLNDSATNYEKSNARRDRWRAFSIRQLVHKLENKMGEELFKINKNDKERN